MLCFIHKWNISRALDSGKPISRLTKRHIAGCEDCSEFLRIGDELARRLTEDAANLLRERRPELGERVQQAMGEPGLSPTHPVLPPKRMQLRPALIAAAALAVIGVSFFWIVRPRPAGMPRLDPLLRLENQRANLVSAMQRAESPYHEEIQEIKKTLQSTADYLAARFEIGLGENN